ncbi:hypothetical protein SLEP1_g31422 [Rubroshorea leprosula]|uniref:Uncharacterized protein n=1 Tax=Rubroshorea leprosula TaxID=152421 RepID=A0AAV5KAE4_9ROSI|nr:hypothetical protein SLEP1_g31422 [Rubroshorea leprosula]
MKNNFNKIHHYFASPHLCYFLSQKKVHTNLAKRIGACCP